IFAGRCLEKDVYTSKNSLEWSICGEQHSFQCTDHGQIRFPTQQTANQGVPPPRFPVFSILSIPSLFLIVGDQPDFAVLLPGATQHTHFVYSCSFAGKCPYTHEK